MTRDLSERIFKFIIRVILLLRKLHNDAESRNIKQQLIRAATSVGANYEEAQTASSRADFRNKINIALKEIREVHYWLKIIAALEKIENAELREIKSEAKELMLIFGSIATKVSKK